MARKAAVKTEEKAAPPPVKTSTKAQKAPQPWFATGSTGISKSKQEDEVSRIRREQRKDQPWRYRLDNGEDGKITFLDSPTFFFREHNLELAGRWGNFFTCLMDFDVCPVCEAGHLSSYIVAATIIDHRETEDNQGRKYKNQKKLFVAKGKAREAIVRQIEKRNGSLQYCVYEMHRGSSPTECATGETAEFDRQLTKEQLAKLVPAGETATKWLAPYDYKTLFAPKSPDELRKMLGVAPPVGSAEEGSAAPSNAPQGKTTKDADSIEDLL